MKSKRKWIALAIVAVGLGSAAWLSLELTGSGSAWGLFTSVLAQPPGPGGPPGFGPPGFGPPGGMGGRERKLVEQYDQDGDGRLNREERQAAREAIKKEPNGPGGGPGGGGRGGRGPGGFSPAAMLAGPLVEALDNDGDGLLTNAEVARGVDRLFADLDPKGRKELTGDGLAQWLTSHLPAPPGFGPGGGGPPGFGPPPGGGPPGFGPPPGGGPPGGGPPGFGPPPGGGPPGGGPPPGFGPGGGGPPGFGPGNFLAMAITQRVDADQDDVISRKEFQTAVERLIKEADQDKNLKLEGKEVESGLSALMPGFPGGPRGPGGGRPGAQPPKPGPKVSPADVANQPSTDLYDPAVLRVLFLDFEDKDWEAELADFYRSDVEVPATLTVDGKTYRDVGVHFRGMSSYFTVSPGYKRSLNLSLDFVDPKQTLMGAKTLNLLNAHEDPSYLSSVLYSHIARQYIPAPKANLVKLVINGESWGVYANVQQFNKDFVAENYP